MNLKNYSDEDQALINGQHELRVVQRAIDRCKWYEYTKKKTLKLYLDLIKKIYEL